MANTLIVYFSRSGHTQRIAAEIASQTGADLERITEQRSRKGLLGYLRSAREAYKKQVVPIDPTDNDPADYDLVILGTPVWAGHVSSPVRAYVAAHKQKLGRIALFCTQGGSGGPKVLRELAELIGAVPAATLVINEKALKSGAYADEMAKFVKSISPSSVLGESAPGSAERSASASGK